MSKESTSTDFTAMSRLSADIDLTAEGKATGFVRVPHSVHRSAYGWIPIPIVRIKNGDGPSVLMQAGNHGDEWEGQIGLGNLIRSLEPKDIKGRLVILPSVGFPKSGSGTRGPVPCQSAKYLTIPRCDISRMMKSSAQSDVVTVIGWPSFGNGVSASFFAMECPPVVIDCN